MLNHTNRIIYHTISIIAHNIIILNFYRFFSWELVPWFFNCVGYGSFKWINVEIMYVIENSVRVIQVTTLFSYLIIISEAILRRKAFFKFSPSSFFEWNVRLFSIDLSIKNGKNL